jgi:hypothetical protein
MTELELKLTAENAVMRAALEVSAMSYYDPFVEQERVMMCRNALSTSAPSELLSAVREAMRYLEEEGGPDTSSLKILRNILG